MRKTYVTITSLILIFVVTTIEAIDITFPVQFQPGQTPTNNPTPEPSQSPEPDSSPDPQQSVSPQPTTSPTPDVSPNPSPTASPVVSPSPSISPQPSPTPTPMLTITPRPSPTPMPTPSPEPKAKDKDKEKENVGGPKPEEQSEATASAITISEEPSDPISPIEPIITSIENLFDEPVTLNELASELEVPINQFKQLFDTKAYYTSNKPNPFLNVLLGLGSTSLISIGLLLLHPKGENWFKQISLNESNQRQNNQLSNLLES